MTCADDQGASLGMLSIVIWSISLTSEVCQLFLNLGNNDICEEIMFSFGFSFWPYSALKWRMLPASAVMPPQTESFSLNL